MPTPPRLTRTSSSSAIGQKTSFHAARAGEPDAVRRVEAVSDRLNLAAAQLALAREYGFASWSGLKEEVEARTFELAELVDAFCEASIRGNIRRAARILAEAPAVADYNVATAAILGDAERLGEELHRDSDLATRLDPRTGWPALHAACASRWYQLEPGRAEGWWPTAQAAPTDPSCTCTNATSAAKGSVTHSLGGSPDEDVTTGRPAATNAQE